MLSRLNRWTKIDGTLAAFYGEIYTAKNSLPIGYEKQKTRPCGNALEAYVQQCPYFDWNDHDRDERLLFFAGLLKEVLFLFQRGTILRNNAVRLPELWHDKVVESTASGRVACART